MEGWSVRHEPTSSKEARTPRNPLWPVNLLDLLVRKERLVQLQRWVISPAPSATMTRL